MAKLTNVMDFQIASLTHGTDVPQNILELIKDYRPKIGVQEKENQDDFVDYTKILSVGNRFTIEGIGDACGKTYEVIEVSQLYVKAREVEKGK